MALYCPDSNVRLAVLGDELRAYREALGLSLAEVTSKVGISTSKLSRMENGRKPQRVEDVAVLLSTYGVRGTRYQDLLALTAVAGELTAEAESAPSALRVLESKATMLVDFQSTLVPALLQTVPYAQAALREVCMVDEASIEDRTANRIHRQAVLRRGRLPQFFALMTETALRTCVGGPEVMRGQMQFLWEAGHKENVRLRIIPDLQHGHPGLSGPFQRLRFHRGCLVVIENRVSSVFIEEPAEVRRYDRIVVELLSVALSERDSLDLIAKVGTHHSFH
ncbi:MAG: helix-turn-helix domain-containing protein [Actinomycetota bacterium]|nr:helix-turn-helix domain-containing protein [Actinomycetota bacterium]